MCVCGGGGGEQRDRIVQGGSKAKVVDYGAWVGTFAFVDAHVWMLPSLIRNSLRHKYKGATNLFLYAAFAVLAHCRGSRGVDALAS